MEQAVGYALGFAILCQAIGFYFRLVRGMFRLLTRTAPPAESRKVVAPLLPDEEGDE